MVIIGNTVSDNTISPDRMRSLVFLLPRIEKPKRPQGIADRAPITSGMALHYESVSTVADGKARVFVVVRGALRDIPIAVAEFLSAESFGDVPRVHCATSCRASSSGPQALAGQPIEV